MASWWWLCLTFLVHFLTEPPPWEAASTWADRDSWPPTSVFWGWLPEPQPHCWVSVCLSLGQPVLLVPPVASGKASAEKWLDRVPR